MGYANPGTIYTIIKTAQEQHVATAVEDQRELALARLDAMQAALAPRVQGGDLPAIGMVLRIIETRCRLLSIYGHEKRRKISSDSWDNCHGPPTLVIRTDDCRHAGCDRQGTL